MVENSVKFLKALADETRFKIILFLLDGKRSVTEITAHVKKAQPTVSLQLKLLELNGLIGSEKEGRKIFYKIIDEKVGKIVKTLEVR